MKFDNLLKPSTMLLSNERTRSWFGDPCHLLGKEKIKRWIMVFKVSLFLFFFLLLFGSNIQSCLFRNVLITYIDEQICGVLQTLGAGDTNGWVALWVIQRSISLYGKTCLSYKKSFLWFAIQKPRIKTQQPVFRHLRRKLGLVSFLETFFDG